MARRSLAVNFVALIGAQVVSKFTTLVSLFLLTRYLGGADFGRYAVALAIPMALEAVADLGLSQVVIREGAGRPKVIRKDIPSVLPVKAILALVSVIASWAIATSLGLGDELIATTVFLAMAKAIDSITLLARAVFEAYERMEFEAISLVLEATVRLVFVLYALVSGFGLVGLAKSLAIGSGVVFCATAVIALHRFGGYDRPDIPRSRALIRAGLPFALLWFSEALGLRVAVIGAAQLAGDTQAGLFAAAARLVEATLVVPSMMGVAVLPVASRYVVSQTDLVGPLFLGTGKLAVTLGLAAAIVLVGIAPAAMPGLFGGGFAAAGTPLQLLALAVPALFVRPLVSRFLLAFRSSGALVATQVVSLTLMVVAALILVPTLGASGAALAVVVGECSALTIGLMMLRRVSPLWAASLLRPVVPSVLSLGLVTALSPLGPVAAVLAAGTSFFALIRVTTVFSALEVGYLAGAVPQTAPVVQLLLAPARVR